MEGVQDTSGHEPELKESFEALRVEFESLKTEFSTVREENKNLKTVIEADQKARILEAFTAKLKPGHHEKAVELFESYQKDPAAWVLENSEKFIQPAKERSLQGKAVIDGGEPAWDLHKERAKLKAEGKVI